MLMLCFPFTQFSVSSNTLVVASRALFADTVAYGFAMLLKVFMIRP